MNTFQAAHESLIARLEREGKAEEITALRAERDALAAALRSEAVTCWLRSRAHTVGEHKVKDLIRAALAKLEG